MLVLEICAESTGDAWEKSSRALLGVGEERIVQAEQVVEIRWLGVHVGNPLGEPRISHRFGDFCDRIQLAEEWRPQAYFSQITGQKREGYWWTIYGKPIWDQLPRLGRMLKQNPSYNKPSVVLRTPAHLGQRDTPCLVYLSFLGRNNRLELGVHFDTCAIEYMQGNLYGLSGLQAMVGESIGLEAGPYHHYCDSLIVGLKHLNHLERAIAKKR